MQSLICISISACLLAAAALRLPTWRAVSATAALVGFLVLTFAVPFPPRGFVMGDGSSIVQDRSNLDDLVRHGKEIRFSAHLSYRLLDRIDAAFGSTAVSPLAA